MFKTTESVQVTSDVTAKYFSQTADYSEDYGRRHTGEYLQVS